jgi:hypothetical protein
MIFPTRIVPALFASLIHKGHQMFGRFGTYLGLNRGIIVANIAITHDAGNDFRKLIDDLTLVELRILKQDEDLIQRVKDILELDAEGIREHMVKVWGLSAESCQNDDWWIDIENIREQCPKWSRAIIEGHYIDGDTFVKWGQKWLLQEVRVNINIKYIAELRDAKKKKAVKELEDDYNDARYWGMYL